MSGKSSKEDIFGKLTPILLIGIVVLAFAVGILWQKVSTLEGEKVANNAQLTEDEQLAQDGKLTEDQVKNIVPVSDEDHIQGSKDAKIILIEYSDFECPFCSTFHSTAQQIKDEYGDDIAWVYRHFPLDFHERARPAAVASECATALGGNDSFWYYIDDIFENQEGGLTDVGLRTIASDLGLNMDEFEKCLVSGEYEDKIEDQYQGGVVAGVTGTPGNFILNDKGEAWLIPGALPFETMKEAIDLALQD